MSVIGDNIRRVRVAAGLTQEEFGKIAGVSNMAVSQWENGRAVPRMGAVQAIADHLGISKGEIIDELPKSNRRRMAASTPAYLPMTRMGTMHAGAPDECYEQGEEVMVPAEVALRHPNGFVMRVNGDCMDMVILDGMDGVIDPDAQPRRGDPTLFLFEETGETVLRCYFPFKDMVVLSASSHADYEDIVIRAEDENPFRILGKLVWRQGAVDA